MLSEYGRNSMKAGVLEQSGGQRVVGDEVGEIVGAGNAELES